MRSSAESKQSDQLCLPCLACASALCFWEHEITRDGKRWGERDGGVREGLTAGQGTGCDLERNSLSPWRHWVDDGFDTKRKWACGLHLIPCVLPSPASMFVFGLEKRSTSLLACSCFDVLLSYVLNRSVYLSSNLLNSMLFFVVVILHVRLGVVKSLSTVTNVNISIAFNFFPLKSSWALFWEG